MGRLTCRHAWLCTPPRVLFLALAISASVVGAEDRRPNVVFILADDLGQHEVACYGDRFYETPHLDALAAAGMRFTDAYAAAAICSPTRASIMTGKYPARLHLTDYIPGATPVGKLKVPPWRKCLPLEEVTIAEALKSAGYATGHFGKWHLNKDKEYRPGRPGDPGSQGFDEVLTTRKPRSDADPSKDPHHVAEITDRAIAFIRAHRQRPFFCYVAHNSIHRPIMERDALIGKYKARPTSDRPHHNPIVAAMVETLDKSVGRVLAALDQLDIADDTLVIFSSDNGCMWGPEVRKPLRGGKGQLFEGGIRVPMIVRWPTRIKPGTICDTPVHSIDFFPTLVEATGSQGSVRKVPDIDGKSLLGLLTGQGTIERDAIYWHYPHYWSREKKGLPSGALRAGRYKLIEWYERSIDGIDAAGALQLFDLTSDIGEQHDLAADRPELAARLYRKLRDWRSSVAARMMTRNPAWRPAETEP